MNTEIMKNFNSTQNAIKADFEYQAAKVRIAFLLERIQAQALINDRDLSWGMLDQTKAAEQYILHALHALGGMSEQEEIENHI